MASKDNVSEKDYVNFLKLAKMSGGKSLGLNQYYRTPKMEFPKTKEKPDYYLFSAYKKYNKK